MNSIASLVGHGKEQEARTDKTDGMAEAGNDHK